MADAPARVPIQVRETEWLRACTASRGSYFVAIRRRGSRSARRSERCLPSPVAQSTHGARRLSLGPDEHWCSLPRAATTTFMAELDSALAGLPHSLVDVSHRQVALELRGAYAEWLLAAVCPLPLDVEVFPVDACTRTVFAKAEIVVWRTGLDAFRVEVARSYCRYVVDLLGEIARELPASPRGAGGVS